MFTKIELNKQQQEAIGHDLGPALVVAGAGTGKTRVITERIAKLIADKKAKPEEILALTFTDKAASEMEERVDVLVPYGVVTTDIMTFHSLGDRILRERGFEIGISVDFKVMNSSQQLLFLNEHFDKLELKYYAPNSNPLKFISDISKHFSRLKDEVISLDEYKSYAKKLQSVAKTEEEQEIASKRTELSRAYGNYLDLCKQKNVFDFGDQINLAIELLRARPSVLMHYQERWKYILVDEFQDTNPAQYELLKLLSGKNQNLMVVGDDDQSIYKFRGAAITNILHFVKDFPNAEQIVLTHNYRSTQKILDAAYRVIQNNNPDRLEERNKISKKLTAQAEGEDPEFKTFEHKLSETEWLAEKIKEVAEKGTSYKDIAILLRKNTQASQVVSALENYQIPYVLGGAAKLYEQEEVRVLINFLHSASDPTDSTSLYQLAVGPIYNLPVATVLELSRFASRRNKSLERVFEEQNQEEFAKVLSDIFRYRELCKHHSAGQVLYSFITETGYLSNLAQQAEERYLGQLKVQNVAKFFDVVREFEEISNHKDLPSFASYLAAIRSVGDEPEVTVDNYEVDAVNILTVHKAKGLEYKTVFIPDLVQDIFPLRNFGEGITMPAELLKEEVPSASWRGEAHEQEERRLFYVALTRAKSKLFLSASFEHGLKRPRKISKFALEFLDVANLTQPTQKSSPLSRIEHFKPASDEAERPLNFLEKEGFLELTPHQIEDYLTCPKEFYYKHILHIPIPRNHAMIYGSAMHKAIEAYFRAKMAGSKITLSDMQNVFESNWSSEGFISLSHEEKRFKQGQDTVKRIYETNEKTGEIPAFVEEKFLVRLPDIKVEINGRFDAIYERGGRVEIRDFKSTAVNDQKEADSKTRGSHQLAFYTLAWQKRTGKLPDLVTLDFFDSQLIGKHQPKPDNIVKTLELVRRAADGIRAGKFDRGDCKYCTHINLDEIVLEK